MSHESLARMIDYSHKMIETISKEVKNNFVARSEYKTLEFKYSIAKEEIDQLKKELKLSEETQTMLQYNSDKQTDTFLPDKRSQPKDVADAGCQTATFQSKDESCQTKSPERKDSQVQAYPKQQSEPIPTQTDSSTESDFHFQATIKEEVAMPNIPSSVAQNPTKRRKRSSVSASCSKINLTIPKQPILSGSGDQLNNKQPVSLDDGILNSEVYKIYSRNEDPKEAMKQIKELNTCLMFEEPSSTFPGEENLKRTSEETLKKLWEKESELRDSKQGWKSN